MNYHFAIVLALSFVGFEVHGQDPLSNLHYVDPTIGTVGIILAPAPPTIHLPNSMLRVLPARRDQLDDQISHFPLTVTSHRISSVFAVMPISGADDGSVWMRKLEYATEKITPYHYATSFEETGDSIEFTPASRSGFFRFHFKDHKKHFLRIGISRDSGFVSVTGKRKISGSEFFSGMRAFFHAELDTDISSIEYRPFAGQEQLLAYFEKKPKLVSFKYGISFISIEQARKNLYTEIPQWDFQKIVKEAYARWDQIMSQIKVAGGTPEQKRIFYTALYRSYERMVDINEYGKYYSAYDRRIHESAEPFFYNIGSPVFENITIQLPNNKTFIIEAKNNSSFNKYIQHCTLNGKSWDKPWFKHDDLMHGGTLTFIMGPKPNKEWGNKEIDSPPSRLDYDPSSD